MTLLSIVLKSLSLMTGACLVLLGGTWILIAASGGVSTGPMFGYAASVAFVVAGAPFLAFPFSAKTAKFLGVFALFSYSATTLWLAFQPDLPEKNIALTQSATIAFAVLLSARVGLALRRNRRS